MDQQSALALAAFLNRAFACSVPTSHSEVQAMQGALLVIQKIANGEVEQPQEPTLSDG